MIRYALLCSEDHGFEAWFPDSDAFDRQNGSSQIGCPHCGTTDVRKAIMAPAIRRLTKRPAASPTEAAVTGGAFPAGAAASAGDAPREVLATPPAALADPAAAELRAALRDLHARLKASAENVGSAFPDQARLIHDGDAPARAIYGTATDDEVRSLVEDGIGVMPIPPLPDDRN